MEPERKVSEETIELPDGCALHLTKIEENVDLGRRGRVRMTRYQSFGGAVVGLMYSPLSDGT